MATRRYPPQDDQGILDAGKQFEDNIGDPTLVGLTADDINRLRTANTDGETKYNEHNEIQILASSKTKAKDNAIGLIEVILQEFNGRTQKHPGMTDELRTKCGLPIYDSIKTTAPVPSEMPVVNINTAMFLRHEITFSGENTKGKPEGVREIEIYQKIGGDATGNPADYSYKGRDTAPPYTLTFDAADSGKQVHYLFCWLNAAGERGPWKMVSATVTSELQSDRT